MDVPNPVVVIRGLAVLHDHSQDLLRHRDTEEENGQHGYAKETWKLPHMPWFDDYDAFMDAVEAKDVTAVG